MHLPENLTSFSQYRNRHQGETLLVCGCGHSLRQLQELPQMVSIGVNDVGRYFTPTYLLVVNRQGDFPTHRYGPIRESKAQAVFSPFTQDLVHAPLIPFPLGKRSGTRFDDPAGLPYTRNSPYVALCLAAFMGAKRIGLLGVDFTHHHFFGATGTHPLAAELPWINGEYQRLAKAFRRQGIDIINLSRESQITAFPKGDLGIFLQRPTSSKSLLSFKARTQPSVHLTSRSSTPMEVSVEKRPHGLIGKCMDAVAKSLAKMGAKVYRVAPNSPHHAPVTFVWNGRNTQSNQAIIHCEHGWLPRWYFQMSPLGINADSHAAPFQFDGQSLPHSHRELVSSYLAQLRLTSPKGYMDVTSANNVRLPKAFFLLPLQMEGDTNIQRHVPSNLKKMQQWIDYVSWHQPNLPLLIKQHPADARLHNSHLKLKVRRKGDHLIPHHFANIHQILKSGRCKGIIALNSNVVHDGLIWNIPSVALGRNIWPRLGPTPFMRHIPTDWRDFQRHYEQSEACRQAYILHLIRNQWSLKDLKSPEKLTLFFRRCTDWLERMSA